MYRYMYATNVMWMRIVGGCEFAAVTMLIESNVEFPSRICNLEFNGMTIKIHHRTAIDSNLMEWQLKS